MACVPMPWICLKITLAAHKTCFADHKRMNADHKSENADHKTRFADHKSNPHNFNTLANKNWIYFPLKTNWSCIKSLLYKIIREVSCSQFKVRAKLA